MPPIKPTLTRDHLLDILRGMNVDLPPNTKLSADKLERRLDRTLDAAQRYHILFPATTTGDGDGDNKAEGSAKVHPKNLPQWKEKNSLRESLARETWGGMNSARGLPYAGSSPEEAFEVVMTLIRTVGNDLDKKRYSYIILKDPSTSQCLVIDILAIYELNSTTPLMLVLYTPIPGSSSSLANIAKLLSQCRPHAKHGEGMLYPIPALQQALLYRLLAHNRKHLSPEFNFEGLQSDAMQTAEHKSKISFILPIGDLNMKDVARLSKNSGCILCGENTRSTCSACLSVQYCGKECQKEDWPHHKSFCRSIASGTWYNITLTPNPFPKPFYKTSINRFDDIRELRTSVESENVAHIADQAHSAPPPNAYDDDYFLVKLQTPLGHLNPQSMLVYDRYKTFELHFVRNASADGRANGNEEAFRAALRAIHGERIPKMYRWAKRVGEWEWKICFDRKPERIPPW